MGGVSGPPVSPMTFSAADSQGNSFVALIEFSDTTPFTLSQVVVSRAPSCAYKNLYFGVGADGTPNSTLAQAPIGGTTVVVSAATLLAMGFTTVTQLLAGQITAGP